MIESSLSDRIRRRDEGDPALPVAVLLVVGVTALLAAVASETGRAQARSSVIDHTYSCTTALTGGLRQIQARAHAASGPQTKREKLAYSAVSSGGSGGTPFVDAPPENSLAWITAGRPTATTTLDDAWLSFTARAGGTVGVNRELCFPTSRRLSFTRSGLSGGRVGRQAIGYECEVPRRVVVRIRAVVDGGAALRERGSIFRVTNATARTAKLVVATPNGLTLAYSEVSESGRASLFTSVGCSLD